MTFATQFKQARQAAGLTQTAAAELLGVTRMTIHNWESGRREPPEVAPMTQDGALSTIISGAQSTFRRRRQLSGS